MTFPAKLAREAGEIAVTVRATVQPYADAVDAPQEFRSRFAGRMDVEILSVIDDATGREVWTTDAETERLRGLAMDCR